MGDIFIFFCKSCLRGSDNHEYYELLGLEKSSSVTQEDIKAAYKKLSLSMHPDKLKQKGIEETDEIRQQFLRIKEAYSVLNDVKKRKLYDDIGETGIKLLEDPAQVDPIVMLKNYQKNIFDRIWFGMFIIILFSSLFVLPVLFSMKCDGSLPQTVTWSALWTPMWLIDMILLIRCFLVFIFTKSSQENSNDANADDEDIDELPYVPLVDKLRDFISTSLFILIQIFVSLRLDSVIVWNWLIVFIPWYFYELLSMINTFISVNHLPKPEHSDDIMSAVNRFNDKNDDDNESADDKDDIKIQQFIDAEYGHSKVVLENIIAGAQICNHLFRLVQAFLLALKLNGNITSNWGVVFMPTWIYFFFQCFVIWRTRNRGKSILKSKYDNKIKAQVYNQHGRDIIRYSMMLCIMQIFPLLCALLLVSRLQVSSFSTFLVIFPVFLILGSLFICSFCTLFCLANINLDELQKQQDDFENKKNDNIPNDDYALHEDDIEKNENVGKRKSYGSFSNPVVSTNSDVVRHAEIVIDTVENSSALNNIKDID